MFEAICVLVAVLAIATIVICVILSIFNHEIGTVQNTTKMLRNVVNTHQDVEELFLREISELKQIIEAHDNTINRNESSIMNLQGFVATIQESLIYFNARQDATNQRVSQEKFARSEENFNCMEIINTVAENLQDQINEQKTSIFSLHLEADNNESYCDSLQAQIRTIMKAVNENEATRLHTAKCDRGQMKAEIKGLEQLVVGCCEAVNGNYKQLCDLEQRFDAKKQKAKSVTTTFIDEAFQQAEAEAKTEASRVS